jgi:hypothetical protein
MIRLKNNAYHQAGYAVVARTLGYKVNSIIITDDGGRTELTEPLRSMEDAYLLAWAGRAAQGTYNPSSLEVSYDDFERIYELAKFPVSVKATAEAISRAYDLVEQHWQEIATLALQLLNGKNVPTIMQN